MLCWCLCPLASSLENGLGFYDGFAGVLNACCHWGFVYLIGRLYLGDLNGIRELASGISIGGFSYILPTLFEIRMSPMIRGLVYGMAGWGGLRFGGYRPYVFLTNGLEHGFWMTVASLTSIWLWKCGVLRRVGPFPVGSVLLPALLITTVLCRSSAAVILLLSGSLILWICTRFNSKALCYALLLVAPTYYVLRIPNVWSGKNLVDFISANLSPERAQSLGFRFSCEDKLAAKAMEQPIFGWGGWGRSRVYDENGRDQAPTDGMWIIHLGYYGLAGLFCWTLVMLLPPCLFLHRFPASLWGTPTIGPLAVIAVALGLYQIDCLVNGFLNLIVVTATGGLICALPSASERRMSIWSHQTTELGPCPEQPALLDGQEGTGRELSADLRGVAHMESSGSAQERLADRYSQLARTKKDQGQPADAKELWSHALDLLSDLAARFPALPGIQKRRWDCVNDLAWFLLVEPDPTVRNPSMAIRPGHPSHRGRS